jgi:hypothetical protein
MTKRACARGTSGLRSSALHRRAHAPAEPTRIVACRGAVCFLQAKRSKDATHYQHADQDPGREVVRAGAPVGRRGAQGMTTARAARHVNMLAAAV